MNLQPLTFEKKLYANIDKTDERLLPVFTSTEPIEINTTHEAVLLSTHLGNLIKNDLKRLNTPTALKTIDWIEKKAVTHPHEVYEEGLKFVQEAEFYTPLEKLGFNRAQTQTDIVKICLLHDIGRLGEVDLKTGEVVNLSRYKFSSSAPHDHAFESAAILERLGIKNPEILLPIKYHGSLNIIYLLEKDPVYQSLSLSEQQRVKSYSLSLSDLDKLANLIQKSKIGIKGSSENYNPCYSGNYQITDICLERIVKNEPCIKSDEKTYGDAILRFIKWTYSIHHQALKPRTAKLTEALWDRLFEEIQEEYDLAKQKDPAVLKATFEKLKQAKPFSIRHALGENSEKPLT